MSTRREADATQAILAQALLKAGEAHAKRIASVQLALGEISDLEQHRIQQRWQELSRGTAAEQARLQFRSIQAEVQCMACFTKYRPLHGEIHCPHCGSYGAKILSGEEFYLEAIEWDDG